MQILNTQGDHNESFTTLSKTTTTTKKNIDQKDIKFERNINEDGKSVWYKVKK